MKPFVICVINVVAIALPLALAEIYLERYKSGYGGEFYNSFWGSKIDLGKLLLGIVEKAYVTPYHLLVWGVIVPGIIFSEWWLAHRLSGGGWWVISLSGMKFVPPLFFAALWLGIATLEDFLWFRLNWVYPDALARLLRGDSNWQTAWVQIGTMMLPRFYILAPIGMVLLLAIQFFIVRRR